MRFILDTDICSGYLRGNPKINNQFLLHLGSLSISVITAGELWTWARRSKASPRASQALSLLLDDVETLEVEISIAERFGSERAKLLDLGTPIGEMDLMIAATALVHDLTLVTHNTSDYQRIPGLRLLDWFE